MKKKYLVACGDSFTEGHNQGKDASWATYLGPKLGLETVNLACGGMSNDWISDETLKWLMRNKDKAKDSVVIIGWTEFGRQYFPFQPIIEEGNWPYGRWPTTVTPADFVDDYIDPTDVTLPLALRELKKNADALLPWMGSLSQCLYKTYKAIFFLKEYCESNDIPYMFLDMIDNQDGIFGPVIGSPHGTLNVKVKNRCKNDDGEYDFFEVGKVMDDQRDLLNPQMTNYLWDSKYMRMRDDNSVLGFIESYPDEAGGGHDGDYMRGNDGHLNIEGAKWISNIIYEHFTKLYNIEHERV